MTRKPTRPSHVTLAQAKAILGLSRTRIDQCTKDGGPLPSEWHFGKQMVRLTDVLRYKKTREARG